MIRTKTQCSYVCDQCKKEEVVPEPQESSIDARYADYGMNFSVDLKLRMPYGWMAVPNRKILCSSDCVLKNLDSINEAQKEIALIEYKKVVDGYERYNKEQIDKLKQ